MIKTKFTALSQLIEGGFKYVNSFADIKDELKPGQDMFIEFKNKPFIYIGIVRDFGDLTQDQKDNIKSVYIRTKTAKKRSRGHLTNGLRFNHFGYIFEKGKNK